MLKFAGGVSLGRGVKENSEIVIGFNRARQFSVEPTRRYNVLLDMPNPSTPVWNDALLSNPHAVADKRLRVRKMFAAIAPSYDLNNRLHSLWMDQAWRRKAVKLANLKSTDQVVDVACGTGDLTQGFATSLERLNAGSSDRARASTPTVGIDFTFEMLPIAGKKAARAAGQSMVFINGDALALPLADSCCDVLSIAFGIRNVADPLASMMEFRRVLRPGGRLVILEFSLPVNPLLRSLYNFYFRKILPKTATLISGDSTGAYKYLPESVNTFIDRSAMQQMMQRAGFKNIAAHAMTMGVCICYIGEVS